MWYCWTFFGSNMKVNTSYFAAVWKFSIYFMCTAQLSASIFTEQFHCTEEGFFKDPNDCSQFFRCVAGGTHNRWFTAHRFMCGPKSIFNEWLGVCIHGNPRFCPENAGQSTTEPVSDTSAMTFQSTTDDVSSHTSERVTETTEGDLETLDEDIENLEGDLETLDEIFETPDTTTDDLFMTPWTHQTEATSETTSGSTAFTGDSPVSPETTETGVPVPGIPEEEADNEDTVQVTEFPPFPAFSLNCHWKRAYRHPFLCRAFYRCGFTDYRLYTEVGFCPPGLFFSEQYQSCIDLGFDLCSTGHRHEQLKNNTFVFYQRNQYDCPNIGFFPFEADCVRFYRCSVTNLGLLGELFRCPDNYFYDEKKKFCVGKQYAAVCQRTLSELFRVMTPLEYVVTAKVVPEEDLEPFFRSSLIFTG